MKIITASLPLPISTNNYRFPGISRIGLKSLLSSGTNTKLEDFKDFVYQYGRYLDLDYKTAKKMLFGQNDKRIEFFKQIATRYNSQKNRTTGEQESPSFAINIFNLIKKPKAQHFYVLNNFDGSFEMLEKLFRIASDKKSLEFLHNFKNIHHGLKYKTQIATDMLSSPHKEEYMKHPEEYKSYLKLHAQDINAVKKLDKLIESGTYSATQYEVKRAYIKLANNGFLGTGDIINETVLNKHYTPEGLSILKRIFYDYTNYGEKLTNRDLEEILKIYKTTNNKNGKLRDSVIHKFKFSADNKLAKDIEHNELVALRELFDKADSDKHAYNFLKKVLGKGVKLEYVQELNDVLKVVPAKKANLFFDNIKGILSVSKGKERYNALLNELENPFYVNDVVHERYEKKGHVPFAQDSEYDKVKKYVLTKVNTLRYKLRNTGPAIEQKQIPLTMKDKFYTTWFRNVQIPPEYSLTLNTQQEAVLKRTLDNLKVQIQDNEKKRALELKRKLKELRKQAKLKVISDVNDIISKKLGKKTLNLQQAMYEKKATKMRLSLLPEIFESIKATREADRLAGWKESVSTKDAIKLYNRINGSNKKLVRYMLLKQKENGTGRFSIKDIIELLDEIEQKAAAQKAIDKDFKQKTLYDKKYDSYIEEFGKVKPTPRKKSTAKNKISPKAR